MRKIRLGRTRKSVSAVSVGTWSHGGSKTVGGQPVGWSGHDDRQASDALVRSWELGLDHWDTADVYGEGQAEALIGSLWKRVPRDDIFLASKVGWDPGPFGHPYHPAQIRARLERSLANLKTDRIELYYLHRCDFGLRDRYLDGALETLHRLRDQGKIRFIGLSDWDSEKLVKYAARVDPDVVQPYRNVVDDAYEESGLKGWVEENDAGVAFFSPLKHGLLLGKYERPVEFGEGDMRSRVPEFRDASALAHYRECRSRLLSRFEGRPEPVLHALVGALLADAGSGCVLVGVRNPAQAEEAASAGEPLPAADLAWVRDLYRSRPSPRGG